MLTCSANKPHDAVNACVHTCTRTQKCTQITVPYHLDESSLQIYLCMYVCMYVFIYFCIFENNVAIGPMSCISVGGRLNAAGLGARGERLSEVKNAKFMHKRPSFLTPASYRCSTPCSQLNIAVAQ